MTPVVRTISMLALSCLLGTTASAGEPGRHEGVDHSASRQEASTLPGAKVTGKPVLHETVAALCRRADQARLEADRTAFRTAYLKWIAIQQTRLRLAERWRQPRNVQYRPPLPAGTETAATPGRQALPDTALAELGAAVDGFLVLESALYLPATMQTGLRTDCDRIADVAWHISRLTAFGREIGAAASATALAVALERERAAALSGRDDLLPRLAGLHARMSDAAAWRHGHEVDGAYAARMVRDVTRDMAHGNQWDASLDSAAMDVHARNFLAFVASNADDIRDAMRTSVRQAAQTQPGS